jgi:hypothetical protein
VSCFFYALHEIFGLGNWIQRISNNLVITYSVLELMVEGRETREVERFIHRQTPSLEDYSKPISIAIRE